jgi:DNA-binding transcriptional regulator YhcF (GntR family)
MKAGQTAVAATIDKLRARGLSDEEIRRLFEAELAGHSALPRTGGRRD